MTLLFMLTLLIYKGIQLRKWPLSFFMVYLVLFLNISSTRASENARLKTPIIASSEVVRLDDIFTHVPFGGDTPVLRAPNLGRKGTISSLKLLEIAKKFRIDWRGHKSKSRVTISRPAFLVKKPAILEALKEQARVQFPLQEGEQYKLQITNTIKPFKASLALKDVPLTVVYQRFPRLGAGAFKAKVYLDGEPTQQLVAKIKGSLTPHGPHMVTNKTIPVGTIITAYDIDTQMRPLSRRPQKAAQHKEALIGKVTKRRLASGSLITGNDISTLNLVRKDGPVTIIYTMNGLRLSMEGRALKDGAMGELILVENLKSKRQLYATIIDKELAQIRATQPPSSQAEMVQKHLQNELFTSSIENALK